MNVDKFKDQELGKVNIKITDLKDQLPHEGWYPLQGSSKNKKERGAIHLQLHFVYRKKLDESLGPPSEPFILLPAHHLYYKELLFKLLQYESPNLSEEVVPLSIYANELLEEYALHFRIGYFFRLLT